MEFSNLPEDIINLICNKLDAVSIGRLVVCNKLDFRSHSNYSNSPILQHEINKECIYIDFVDNSQVHISKINSKCYGDDIIFYSGYKKLCWYNGSCKSMKTFMNITNFFHIYQRRERICPKYFDAKFFTRQYYKIFRNALITHCPKYHDEILYYVILSSRHYCKEKTLSQVLFKNETVGAGIVSPESDSIKNTIRCFERNILPFSL